MFNVPVALRSVVVPAIISAPDSCVIFSPAVIETLVPASIPVFAPCVMLPPAVNETPASVSIAPSVRAMLPAEETFTAPDEKTSELRLTLPPSAVFDIVIVPASAVISCNETSPEVVFVIDIFPGLSASSKSEIAVFSACVIPSAAVMVRFPLMSSMSALILRALSAVTVNALVPTISPRFKSEPTPCK